jgi:hypothetical protein
VIRRPTRFRARFESVANPVARRRRDLQPSGGGHVTDGNHRNASDQKIWISGGHRASNSVTMWNPRGEGLQPSAEATLAAVLGEERGELWHPTLRDVVEPQARLAVNDSAAARASRPTTSKSTDGMSSGPRSRRENGFPTRARDSRRPSGRAHQSYRSPRRARHRLPPARILRFSSSLRGMAATHHPLHSRQDPTAIRCCRN